MSSTSETTSPTPVRLGIISALSQEQAGLIGNMKNASTLTRGRREYAAGTLWGVDTVCVLSRLGKVAAAATAATLIERFDTTHIVFTGVAGAADAAVRVGDIVLATELAQHDIDASPLFPRFEIPLTGTSRFVPDGALTRALAAAAADFLDKDIHEAVPAPDRRAFNLDKPRIHRGLIASGDQFITCRTRRDELASALPGLLAVEMEGAAVAQVCADFGVPFAVMRTISDGADESAPVDFMRFVDSVASRYAFGIIRRFCLGPI
jgi:adenosylhomocysteine nucleosidase